MEESEKRKERLKAMRTEASQSGVENDSGNSTESHHLSNPLIEISPSPQTNSYSTPRFDYYTDPMSAFSSNKRRSQVCNQNSQAYFTPPRPVNRIMTPFPAFEAPTHFSPDHRIFQARVPYHSAGPWNPEMTSSPAHQVQTNYSPDQRMYPARGPHPSSGPFGSPVGSACSYGTHLGTPGVWNGSAGASSFHLPSNSSGVGNFSNPGYGGSPSFNSGQGRGRQFSNSPNSSQGCGSSPSFNSGQGRGPWFSNSPNSGRVRGSCPNSNPGRSRGRWSGFSRGSQRGSGSHGSVSAELRPDLYYDKSMVEDPWKFLKPVIWRRKTISAKSLFTPNTQKSSLPKSTTTKKARISESSSSQPSLAEYLAAAFNEVVEGDGGEDTTSL